MKYIRTQNGKIMEIDLSNEHDQLFYNHYKNNPFLDDFEKGCLIIKETDNVEKLFDCLVLWKEIIPIRHSNAKYDIDDIAITQGSYAWDEKKYKEAYRDTYGAIWTNEGLIYKAKIKRILPNGEIDWKLL